ncbi:MAG TPA: VTT domain-containing protein, partial [Gemmatimonadales bacterium]
MSQLPPAAVYTVLALLAAIENVIPPVPSDAAVALGAFLSNRGLTKPAGVFIITWMANLAGAAAVYFAARRYGRRLFATAIGRRLLAPRSLAIIEREYLRFGVMGIFVSRFLPGIRAVVPPFAGLVNLSPLRTLVPMGIASGIWYGGIILLGSVIGAEWDRINHIILGVNRTLGIL